MNRLDYKWYTSTKYLPRVTNISKMTKIKGPKSVPEKASSLSWWLFLKYDMSYKSYRRKTKKRRDELREEYLRDTEEYRQQKEKRHVDLYGEYFDSDLID